MTNAVPFRGSRSNNVQYFENKINFLKRFIVLKYVSILYAVIESNIAHHLSQIKV